MNTDQMKKYDIAIFDVDGTLLDTTEGVLASVQYTIEKNGLPSLSEKELKTFIGPPIQNSFQKYYGIQGEALQELAECFRDRYKNVDLLKASPYPGIYETMQCLDNHGIKLAIATYKRQDYARSLLCHFGFDKYTSVMYGADNYNKLKKQDIIVKCMEHYGISDYSTAVMVGDSDNDALGAEKIGVNFLGVTYGFGFSSKKDVDMYPSIGCVSTAADIPDYFIFKKDDTK